MKQIGFVVAVVIGVLGVCNQALAFGGYWKPMEGRAYTVKFKDEAKNVVLGEFKKTVRWEWDNDGAVTVTEWDDEATFTFKDEAGKDQKIPNATIKARIKDLQPGMTGALKGDIKDTAKPLLDTKPTNWPKYSGELTGRLEVRVKNPNDFKVRVGLRSGGNGKDFTVAANDRESVRVPNGRYEIYFQYSTDPNGLYQGDSFTLNDNGVEIQIVKVVNGNYGIRKVK
jgi:hypothetical protein